LSRVAIRPFLAVLLLSSCASGSVTGPVAPSIDLRLEFRAPSESDVNAGTLQCGTAESGTGFLASSAHAACQAVAKHPELLTEPPPQNRACTFIYGGPETSRVTGTLEGRRVDRTFNRADGCAISEWEQLKALVDPRQ